MRLNRDPRGAFGLEGVAPMDRMPRRRLGLLLAFVVWGSAVVLCSARGQAAEDSEARGRVTALEQQVGEHEEQITDLKEEASGAFLVLFLFGVVLAFWAQARGRSGCGWFVLGFIPGINIIAALIALSEGPKKPPPGSPPHEDNRA